MRGDRFDRVIKNPDPYLPIHGIQKGITQRRSELERKMALLMISSRRKPWPSSFRFSVDIFNKNQIPMDPHRLHQLNQRLTSIVNFARDDDDDRRRFPAGAIATAGAAGVGAGASGYGAYSLHQMIRNRQAGAGKAVLVGGEHAGMATGPSYGQAVKGLGEEALGKAKGLGTTIWDRLKKAGLAIRGLSAKQERLIQLSATLDQIIEFNENCYPTGARSYANIKFKSKKKEAIKSKDKEEDKKDRKPLPFQKGKK